MKMGLYIITHKKIKNIFPNDRKIMMVGAINKELPEGYFSDYDKDKENISVKNPNYCELTGFYYFTKHDDSEVLGLEHYRRMFIKRLFYLFRYPILKKKDIEKIMTNYDVIVPKIHKYDMPLIKRYGLKGHYTSDLIEIGKIIDERCPEYKASFDKVMNDNKTYFCNMLIGKRDIVVGYANWLFDILFELEKRIDISDRTAYEQRVFGFLSERLLLVYLTKHSDIKVCEKRIQMVEKSALKSQIDRVVSKIKSIFKKKR